MESSLTAPFRGRVRQVLVGHERPRRRAGAARPDRAARRRPAAAQRRPRRVRVARHAAPAAEGCREHLRRLEWLVLGYDIGAGEVERIVADLHGACADRLACDPALLAGEHRLLRMFADVRALSRPRHDEADPETPWLRSPQEHLNAWLRSLDAEAEGLPADVRGAAARRARPLRDRRPRPHAGARGGLLPPAPRPGARARPRAPRSWRSSTVASSRPAQLAGHARRRLPRGARPPGGGAPTAATRSSPTSPARCATATSTSPSSPPPRDRVYAEMEPHVAALAEDPARPDRDERIAALVACPRPLAALLTARMRARRAGAAAPARRGAWRGATTACARSRASSPR